ncbi:ABC transporter permease, partial [Listeria monocytogenes]|nr:ABC transporter permease [Listeria monocytogenes]
VKEQGTPEKAASLKGNEAQMVLTITYDEDAQKEMVGEKFTLASPNKPNIKIKSVVQNSPISTIPGLLVLPDSQVAKIAADSSIAAHSVESISVKDAKQAQALDKKM